MLKWQNKIQCMKKWRNTMECKVLLEEKKNEKKYNNFQNKVEAVFYKITNDDNIDNNNKNKF